MQLRMLNFAIQGFPFLIRRRQSSAIVITFGETNLLAALFVSLTLQAPLSIGVRSNILTRHKLLVEDMPLLQKIWANVKFEVGLRFWQFAYRYASQITVQTPQAKAEFLVNFNIPENKVEVIENDLPPKFKLRYFGNRKPGELRSLLFVGNETRIKGFDVLVKAIPQFHQCTPSIKQITLVGVSDNAVQAASAELAKTGIDIVWRRRHNDIPSLMQEHDLLVVPSREDQFPNVVLEALAIGLPVVGSAVDGIKYMLADDWILFPPGDVAGLVRCVSRVAEPAGYVRAMDIARERASYFDFDWEDRYIDILERNMELRQRPLEAGRITGQ
ncbi:MAG: glycosyltransferase family 4 protein [Leptolyngbyaceae cyanobacterium MO_188.B28]|nr:glycosyltransferase family 4 protein [Leptolyngbyaceae cyanobacterium MO_188.B28]